MLHFRQAALTGFQQLGGFDLGQVLFLPPLFQGSGLGTFDADVLHLGVAQLEKVMRVSRCWVKVDRIVSVSACCPIIQARFSIIGGRQI